MARQRNRRETLEFFETSELDAQAEKIANIQAAIAAGTYRVSAARVVDSMLRSPLLQEELQRSFESMLPN